MGQKINPVGLRVGVIRTWESRWFSEKNYAEWLREDLGLRKFIKDELIRQAKLRAAEEGGSAARKRQNTDPAVSRVEIERAPGRIKFIIHTARPGQVIGKSGRGIEELKKVLAKRTKKDVFIDVREVRKPDGDAQLVAESICQQIERRMAFRRAMKRAMSVAMKQGIEGVRLRLSGRLGGAEMSRTEAYREGRIPLHTLRADIDFGFAEARTTYGSIGCKVWVYKGEVLEDRTARRARIEV